MATAAFEIHGNQAPAEAISSTAGPAVRFLPSVGILEFDARPEPRPSHVLLGFLSKVGYRVIKAIPVKLEEEGDNVIASWVDADEFGTGASMSAACEELGRTLAELYESLKTDKDKLGPDLVRVWNLLQEHVVESK